MVGRGWRHVRQARRRQQPHGAQGDDSLDVLLTRNGLRRWPTRAAGIAGLALAILVGSACSETKPPTSPDSPTPAPEPPPISLALVKSPVGTGVQWGTTFIFDITGTPPANAAFVWRFGDGSFAEGAGPASHVYSQSGSYTAIVEVTSPTASFVGSVPVAIRSLLGTWDGTIAGHTNVRPGRSPITSFTLTVFKTPNPADRVTPFGSTVSVDGLWLDNTGCRVGTGVGSFPGFLVQTLDTSTLFGFDPAAVGVSIGIEQFECNGVSGFEDFPLTGTADAAFNIVSGRCTLGGPDCRFQMVRR